MISLGFAIFGLTRVCGNEEEQIGNLLLNVQQCVKSLPWKANYARKSYGGEEMYFQCSASSLLKIKTFKSKSWAHHLLSAQNYLNIKKAV